jgi:tetratricopeptide (TPR) repeat protein
LELMKIRRFLHLCILISLFSLAIHAQNKDSLLNRAIFYMENREHSLAIPLLDSFILQSPDEFRPYELAGDCYKEAGLFRESIIAYQKAFALQPGIARLLYKLGDIYDIIENTDSSVLYFENFLKSEPHSVEGHLRLSIIFMNYPSGVKDSCIYYAKRAVEIEPQNSRALNILAMSYFSMGNYEMARKTALDELKRDSTDKYLLQTLGHSSFFLHDYENACRYFSKAIGSSPENTLLRDYQVLSQIMRNTDSQKLFYNTEGRAKFQWINSNASEIEKSLTKISDPYYYRELLKRFRNDPSKFGLDNFFMLYYSYSNLPEYSPYKAVDTELNELLDKHLSKAVEIAENLIIQYPVNFPLYLTLAGIYQQSGDFRRYSENMLCYFGFLEAIKATGEGKDQASAYIITQISHEYEIAFNMGITVSGQKLVTGKKHYYDVLTGKDKKGNEVLVWFNIDKPYKWFLKSLPYKARKNLHKKVK